VYFHLKNKSLSDSKNLMIHLKIYISFLFLLVSNFGYCQKEFQRTFGGKKTDNANEIVSTKDKGFMTIGSTNSFGSGKNDIYVVKMDSLGNLMWSKTYGGFLDDFGHSIDKTPDGNYIIAAHSLTYSKDYTDVCLIKIDEDGNVIWGRTYGLDKSDYANRVIVTKDGGFVLLGETINFLNHEKNSDILVVRMDSEGAVLWAKVYGGNNTDYGYSIQETTDGGFIIGGETNSYGAGEWDFYCLKLKKDGVVQFSKTFGDKKADYGRYAIQTKDGGYLIGGNTYNFNTYDIDLCLVKMNGSGAVEWSKTYGGTGTDYLLCLKNMDDNKFIASGYTNSFGLAVEDAFIMIFNESGKVVSSKAFGGLTHDYGVSLLVNGTDVILCGSTQSFGVSDDDIYVVRTKQKWKEIECNTNALYPLNTGNVTVKVGSGHYELELHCQEKKINVVVKNALTAEQILCIEDLE
jgi:hypothetical protein